MHNTQTQKIIFVCVFARKGVFFFFFFQEKLDDLLSEERENSKKATEKVMTEEKEKIKARLFFLLTNSADLVKVLVSLVNETCMLQECISQAFSEERTKSEDIHKQTKNVIKDELKKYVKEQRQVGRKLDFVFTTSQQPAFFFFFFAIL